jgi:hypothetical protein
VETEALVMTQKDRDRLVVLKKAQKQLITQREAAEELQLTERHTRRLVKREGRQRPVSATSPFTFSDGAGGTQVGPF